MSIWKLWKSRRLIRDFYARKRWIKVWDNFPNITVQVQESVGQHVCKMKLKILFMFLLVPCYGRPLSRIPREAEIQTEQNKILNLGDEASKIVVKGGDCSRLENVTIIMNDQVGSCQISPSPVQLYPVLTGIVNAKNSYKTSLKVCKVHRYVSEYCNHQK